MRAAWPLHLCPRTAREVRRCTSSAYSRKRLNRGRLGILTQRLVKYDRKKCNITYIYVYKYNIYNVTDVNLNNLQLCIVFMPPNVIFSVHTAASNGQHP